MDPNLKDLLAQTNLDDLLQSNAPQRDYNQPVATPLPAPVDPARSTTDPLQVHFASANVVGGLRSDHPVSGRLKMFALVFIGGPTILTGLILLEVVWNGTAGPVGKTIGAVLALGMIAFWPMMIFAKRRKRPSGKTQ